MGAPLAAPWRTGAGRAALLLLAALTLFRLAYAARLGLAEDEAYYWQWSRHPDIAYFDGGPLIAYTIRAGTRLWGDTLLGVRFFVVLLAAATGWLLFLTARRWTSERASLWALALASVAPLFAVGSVLATYDAPQVCLWAGALYALTRTLQEDRPAGWYVVGGLVGLGTLAKLPMLFFAPSALLFLLLSPPHRRHLATPHPYFAFLLALLVCAPPLAVWNARHDGLFVKHLFAVGNRTGTASSGGATAVTLALRLRWMGDFWGGQILAVSPLLFVAELGALLRRGGRSEPVAAAAHRFFLAFWAPLLAFCLLVALRSRQEINWPVSAHVTALMAVAAGFARAWDTKRRIAQTLVAFSVGLALVLTLIVLFPAVLPLLGLRVSSQAAQKLNQTYGWPETAAQVAQARRQMEQQTGRPVFVAGISYRVNSLLAFYLPGRPQTQALFLGTRRDQYLLWTRPETLVGRDALLCLEESDTTARALTLARRVFGSVAPAPGSPVVITRPGFAGPVRVWRLYACRNFRGYDPNDYATAY